MSNIETSFGSRVAKVALKDSDSTQTDKQIGTKRPLSTPQSPLKIEQQKRREEEALDEKVVKCLMTT